MNIIGNMIGKLPYDPLMDIIAEQNKTFIKQLIIDLVPELSLDDLYEVQELTIDLIKEFKR